MGLILPHPSHASLLKVGQEELPLDTSFILIDPICSESGEMMDSIEFLIHELRHRYPSAFIGIHLTYWIGGIAYGSAWQADFLIYHEPTFVELWGFLPEGESLSSVGGWVPPPPWKLLGKEYRPSLKAVEALNAYLKALQRFRRNLHTYQPQLSSLYRTQTPERVYIHLTCTDIQKYVDDLRC
ncbi:MAG: hypothetical protein RMK19_08100 [Bacteroidia bacterium]|nr:hypothetical protein [Bacteroidia bacterium]MDW8015958.1 hypothetical protein [Bacteroidia bacterium]